MYKTVCMFLITASLLLAQNNSAEKYSYYVMAETGQVIEGQTLARIGGLQQTGILRFEDAPIQLRGDGQPIFYGTTDRGLRGVFGLGRALALEGVRLSPGDASNDVTINDVLAYSSGTLVAANYTRAKCPKCRYTGLFLGATNMLELDATHAGIIDFTSDAEQTIYALVGMNNPSMEALYRNGKIVLKTGDPIAQGKIASFQKGMRISEEDLGMTIPIFYDDGVRPGPLGGILLNGNIVAPLRGFVGMTRAKVPIFEDINHLTAGGQTLFTGRPGMQSTVVNENSFAVKSQIPGGGGSLVEEAIYTADGQTFTLDSLKGVTDIPDCCAFVGRPAVNFVGDVAFQIRSRGANSFKSAIIVASKHPLRHPTGTATSSSAIPAPGAKAASPLPKKSKKEEAASGLKDAGVEVLKKKTGINLGTALGGVLKKLTGGVQ